MDATATALNSGAIRLLRAVRRVDRVVRALAIPETRYIKSMTCRLLPNS